MFSKGNQVILLLWKYEWYYDIIGVYSIIYTTEYQQMNKKISNYDII